MKSITLSFVCSILLFMSSKAQVAPQAISSSIEKVIVYVNSAQVFRKATVTLQKGNNEIVFKNLSPMMDKQSIVLGCKGKAIVMLVANQLNKTEPANKESDVKKWETEKMFLMEKMKRSQNMMKVFQTEENLLLKNQTMNNEHVVLKAADLKDMADFQRSRFTDIYLQQISISKTIDSIDVELKNRDKQIFELNNKQAQTSGEIKTLIHADETTQAEISFSYQVPNAGWFASYDLRVTDINTPIDLKLKANVFQNTGEEWRDVKLTLSNGNPTDNSVAPVLPIWYIGKNTVNTIIKPINNYLLNSNITEIKGRVYDIQTKEAISFANVLIDGSTIGTITDEDGNFTIKVSPLANKLHIKTIGYNDFYWEINASNIEFPMQPSKMELAAVMINYKKSLDDVRYAYEAGSTVQTISRQELKASASRNITDIAVSSSPGVYQTDGGRGIQINGARGDGSRIYVDGVPQRGGIGIPRDALESVEMLTSGTPAKYGDSEISNDRFGSLNLYRSSSSEKYISIDPNKPVFYSELQVDVFYEIQLPYSVPTDGKSYQVEIKTLKMPAYYEYYAVPKLDKSAFLTAHVPAWQDLKLIDGEINLFLEGKFIGKSVLQTHFADDTLNISLGKDNGIFVERKKVKDFSKNMALGDNKIEYRSFDIQIKNNKSYQIHLKVEDQFPLSTYKNISVEEIAYLPGKLNPDTKKVVWEFDLGTHEEKKLELKYSVKHDKDITLQVE